MAIERHGKILPIIPLDQLFDPLGFLTSYLW